MLEFERAAWLAGHRRVAGIDEAGRGPLAGPVVAAAVCIEAPLLEEAAQGVLDGLTDSKKLSPAQRDRYFAALTALPGVHHGVAVIEADEIDRINILRATHKAMRIAVEGVASRPDFLLVDGLPVPNLPVASQAIVKGDSLSLLIAAASVIAKVTRDRIMDRLSVQYTGYGFERHKGYGTPAHLDALRRLGPCPIHRRTFAPVSQMSLDL